MIVEFRELCQCAQNNRGGLVFYDRFIYLCSQKGVSPSRAAMDAGISKSLVTKWKNNNAKDPSPDVIRKLSKYFNISVSELLGEEIEKAPTEDGERSVSDDDIMFALWGDTDDVGKDDLDDVKRYAAFVRERKRKK